VVIPEVLVTAGKEVILDISLQQRFTDLKEVTLRAHHREWPTLYPAETMMVAGNTNKIDFLSEYLSELYLVRSARPGPS
jgi:hypothetical protein